MIRRERNTSREVKVETRIEVRNEFMTKLRLSGYNEKQRLEIMLSGLRGYRRMCETEDEGGRKINRRNRI